MERLCDICKAFSFLCFELVLTCADVEKRLLITCADVIFSAHFLSAKLGNAHLKSGFCVFSLHRFYIKVGKCPGCAHFLKQKWAVKNPVI